MTAFEPHGRVRMGCPKMAVTCCAVIPILMLRIDVRSTGDTACGRLQLATASAPYTNAPIEIHFARLKQLIVHHLLPSTDCLLESLSVGLSLLRLAPRNRTNARQVWQVCRRNSPVSRCMRSDDGG